MTTTAMLIVSKRAMEAASTGTTKHHTPEASALQHVHEEKTIQVKLLLSVAKRVSEDEKMYPTQPNAPASSNDTNQHLQQEETLYKNMKEPKLPIRK